MSDTPMEELILRAAMALMVVSEQKACEAIRETEGDIKTFLAVKAAQVLNTDWISCSPLEEENDDE